MALLGCLLFTPAGAESGNDIQLNNKSGALIRAIHYNVVQYNILAQHDSESEVGQAWETYNSKKCVDLKNLTNINTEAIQSCNTAYSLLVNSGVFEVVYPYASE